MPDGKTKEKESAGPKFSKAEDALIRSWLLDTHGIRVPQFTFWKRTAAQGLEKILEDHPQANIKAGDLMTAARKTL